MYNINVFFVFFIVSYFFLCVPIYEKSVVYSLSFILAVSISYSSEFNFTFFDISENFRFFNFLSELFFLIVFPAFSPVTTFVSFLLCKLNPLPFDSTLILSSPISLKKFSLYKNDVNFFPSYSVTFIAPISSSATFTKNIELLFFEFSTLKD